MLDHDYVSALEEHAWSIAEQRFGPSIYKQRQLVEAIALLSRAYNQQEGDIPRGNDDISALAARLLFFTIADLPKIAYPLAEVLHQKGISNKKLKILDIGAGCGTLTFGALGLLKHEIEQCWMLDHDEEALAFARQLYAKASQMRHSPTGPLKTVQADITQLQSIRDLNQRFDLILVGNLFTELDEKKHQPILAALIEKLETNGILIVIEPATQRSSEALHTQRIRLMNANPNLKLYGPCPSPKPCPMLNLPERDAWCHEIRIWQLPPEKLRKLSAACGLRRRDLKFSYFSIGKSDDQDGTLEKADRRPNIYRVIGSIQRTKGKRLLNLCHEGKIHTLLRLDRYRSDENRIFEKLKRGFFVEFEALGARKDFLEINEKTRLTILDPAAAYKNESIDD